MAAVYIIIENACTLHNGGNSSYNGHPKNNIQMYSSVYSAHFALESNYWNFTKFLAGIEVQLPLHSYLLLAKIVILAYQKFTLQCEGQVGKSQLLISKLGNTPEDTLLGACNQLLI